jgi:hypothetical protein
MIILKRMRIMKIILATNANKYYSYSWTYYSNYSNSFPYSKHKSYQFILSFNPKKNFCRNCVTRTVPKLARNSIKSGMTGNFEVLSPFRKCLIFSCFNDAVRKKAVSRGRTGAQWGPRCGATGAWLPCSRGPIAAQKGPDGRTTEAPLQGSGGGVGAWNDANAMFHALVWEKFLSAKSKKQGRCS